MSFLVYNLRNHHIYKSGFSTLSAAKRSATCAHKKNRKKLYQHLDEYYQACDEMYFYKHIDKMVTVPNLMSGKPVEIRESEAGGCCDPSTERYWSM